MLVFPENYFKEEVRSDFTISSTMKRAWAAQLEVLVRIIDICDKYHIQYHAAWGTLLGTIRHRGFIPWDDDIDIEMKRNDYIRFLKAAPPELPAEYCILNTYTEENWKEPFTRITNGRSIDISPKRLEQFHNCPFVVGIDIFPLDNIPDNPEDAKYQMELLNLIDTVKTLLKGNENLSSIPGGTEIMPQCEAAFQEGLDTLEAYTGVHIEQTNNIRNQLNRLYDKICMMSDREDSRFLTLLPWYQSHPDYLLKREWLSETTLMPFENIQIAVPKAYDEILRRCYGDYMIPVKCQADHDYPFYKQQLQTLQERGMWKEF